MNDGPKAAPGARFSFETENVQKALEQEILVSSPTRVDLAGGTLDLYPLYVLAGGGITLNAAINLKTSVRLRRRQDQRVRIISRDLETTWEVESIADLDPDRAPAGLNLLCRILGFYRPRTGLEIECASDVPPGSGLGGSSSMLVSLSTALIQLENLPVNKERLIEVGANLEAHSIGIPTGKQDYFPAAFGGFHALWFETDGVHRERLDLAEEFRRQLRRRMILAYSGGSRFSGANNWTVLKRFIDDVGGTRGSIIRLKEATLQMYRALQGGRFDDFVRRLDEEWSARKEISPGITSPQLEILFQEARKAGAQAIKVCGAGGGGCFICIAREERSREVREAIESKGGRILEFEFSESGVGVSSSP